MKPRILVVDDYKDIRDFMFRALGAKYEVILAADAESAMSTLRGNGRVDLMISDLRMPGTDGLTLLKAAKAARPDLAVIMLTAYGSVETAVQAMKDGADDFLTKPVDLDQLELRVAKAIKTHALEAEVVNLRAQLDGSSGLDGIVGDSPAMREVFRLVRAAAPSKATVLIQGPSGTGKELVARAIHDLSPRAGRPFVAAEFAALNDNLIESELFGHERGAFTGAVARRIGRFEEADGGTIFLDEISEIPPSTQVKLLRVLETRTFQRLGSNVDIATDIRVVAACNRDLAKMVEEGKFREDLYYRLNVIDIRLPPLKERKSDIPLLVDHFVKECAAANSKKVDGVSPQAMRLLENHSWPGNVRELRNTVEKMVVLSQGPMLEVEDVPPALRSPSAAAPETLRDAERERVLAAIREAGGNHTLAAKNLGISRRTIYRRLESYEKQEKETEQQ